MKIGSLPSLWNDNIKGVLQGSILRTLLKVVITDVFMFVMKVKLVTLQRTF